MENGDIIHFSLQGCNNDNAGRERDDFSAKLYTKEDWENEIQKWESQESSEFELKIGSRCCNWADYGKHLRTMTKRSKTFDELKDERTVYGIVYDGITYYPENEEPVDYPAGDERIDDIIYGIWYGRYKGSYKSKTHYVYTQAEILDTLKTNASHVRFYIGKKR